MTCVSMASDCAGTPTKGVYLNAVDRFQRMCQPCIDFATRAGMNPRDRRAVERLPEWRKRSLAKVLDHGSRVA